jgi:hypothetical protein
MTLMGSAAKSEHLAALEAQVAEKRRLKELNAAREKQDLLNHYSNYSLGADDGSVRCFRSLSLQSSEIRLLRLSAARRKGSMPIFTPLSPSWTWPRATWRQPHPRVFLRRMCRTVQPLPCRRTRAGCAFPYFVATQLRSSD